MDPTVKIAGHATDVTASQTQGFTWIGRYATLNTGESTTKQLHQLYPSISNNFADFTVTQWRNQCSYNSCIRTLSQRFEIVALCNVHTTVVSVTVKQFCRLFSHSTTQHCSYNSCIRTFRGIVTEIRDPSRCIMFIQQLYPSILAILVYLCDCLTWQHQLLQLYSNFS